VKPRNLNRQHPIASVYGYNSESSTMVSTGYLVIVLSQDSEVNNSFWYKTSVELRTVFFQE